MSPKNNYEDQLALIQDENINVSSTNDGKDFIVLVSGIVGIVLVFIMSFNMIAGFCIDKISNKTQAKIESILQYKHIEDKKNTSQYENQIKKLEYIRNKIVSQDKSIQNKSPFNIYVMKNKQVNAMIHADGSIIFTTALLDKNIPEQELAFVLAHEIGHYAHRDHLKSISKQLAIVFICTLTGQINQVGKVAQSVSEIEFLSHSRSQERNADLYAGNMLIKIYGTNQGGKNFINRIKENEKTPEFLYYFSSHPSWDSRIKLLSNQK